MVFMVGEVICVVVLFGGVGVGISMYVFIGGVVICVVGGGCFSLWWLGVFGF